MELNAWKNESQAGSLGTQIQMEGMKIHFNNNPGWVLWLSEGKHFCAALWERMLSALEGQGQFSRRLTSANTEIRTWPHQEEACHGEGAQGKVSQACGKGHRGMPRPEKYPLRTGGTGWLARHTAVGPYESRALAVLEFSGWVITKLSILELVGIGTLHLCYLRVCSHTPGMAFSCLKRLLASGWDSLRPGKIAQGRAASCSWMWGHRFCPSSTTGLLRHLRQAWVPPWDQSPCYL